MGWLSEKIGEIVKDTIRKDGSRIVKYLITPEYVHGLQREVFAKNPTHTLTEVGFGAAIGLSLNDIWKDMPVKECTRVMWDDLNSSGCFYGDQNFDWSYSAAKDLAREYASTYGETT